MGDHDRLAERFETHRSHLRGVAYRMLGSLAEADDAVQEAWLRLSRSDTSSVQNLAGWLTRVGAQAVAKETRVFSRRARFARLALVDGTVGIVVAPRGRLRLAIGLTIKDDKVAEIDVIADPQRLHQLDLAVLSD